MHRMHLTLLVYVLGEREKKMNYLFFFSVLATHLIFYFNFFKERTPAFFFGRELCVSWNVWCE